MEDLEEYVQRMDATFAAMRDAHAKEGELWQQIINCSSPEEMAALDQEMAELKPKQRDAAARFREALDELRAAVERKSS